MPAAAPISIRFCPSGLTEHWSQHSSVRPLLSPHGPDISAPYTEQTCDFKLLYLGKKKPTNNSKNSVAMCVYLVLPLYDNASTIQPPKKTFPTGERFQQLSKLEKPPAPSRKLGPQISSLWPLLSHLFHTWDNSPWQSQQSHVLQCCQLPLLQIRVPRAQWATNCTCTDESCNRGPLLQLSLLRLNWASKNTSANKMLHFTSAIRMEE